MRNSQCPKCHTTGEFLQEQEGGHVLACPACFHEWQIATAYEAMEAIRAQLQLYHSHRLVYQGMRESIWKSK